MSLRRFSKPRMAGLLLLPLGLALGCSAQTQYIPQVLARGELTLRYDNGFETWAAGRRVSRGLTHRGLPSYVACVPEARRHAILARKHGDTALALSIIGGVLGGVSLGGLYGLVDKDNQWLWLGSGIGAATVGTVFAGLGRMYKNSANGHAVDAMNYYNDAVGSLGATCADLRYPAPSGPAGP